MKETSKKFRLKVNDVTQLNVNEINALKSGEVLLIRSEDLKEKGDHYILVTGPPIQKEHGWRVRTEEYPLNGNGFFILNKFEPNEDRLIALHLNQAAKDKFHKLYNIIP